MDSDKVRELAARVEDHRLDFKSGLYASNDELAKDLMTFANLLPPGSTGHIILGIKQLPDDTGEIVGVDLGACRDSHYQQKVAGKLNRSPQFTFFPIQLPEGELVGVFEIVGIGERPYFPLVTSGNLKKFIPQKRLGSSTADASPDEVREWVLEDRPSKDPAALLDRIPREERDRVLLAVDKLNKNLHPIGLPAPLATTLLEVDTSSAAAKFYIASQNRQLTIPLSAITNVYRADSHWRVIVDGFLSDETWEYMPTSRARRRETA